MAFYNYTFEHWPAALMSFIPLLINIGLASYIFIKLNKNRVNTLFLLFLIPLCLWQLNDTLVRISATSATAASWFYMLFPLTCLLVPAGLHFTLLITKRERYIHKPLVLILIYFPMLFFLICNMGRLVSYHFTSHSFFGWRVEPNPNVLTFLYALWMSAAVLIILFLLWQSAIINKGTQGNRRMQSMLIAIGFTGPILQGIITEFMFPHLFGIPPISVTSSSMCFFSVCTIIALRKYRLLDYSPAHAWSEIVNHMGQGLMVTNQEGKIMFTNERFSRITKYDYLELVGSNVGSIFGMKTEENELRSEDAETASHVQYKEMKISTRTDDEIWLEIFSSKYINKGNEESGIIWLISDITHRKELGKKLDQKIRDLNMFIYRASHDLKAPLASIMGLNNLAKKEVKDLEARKYLEMINTSTQRLDITLKELSDLANITQGKIQFEAVGLEGLIMQVLSSLDQQPNFSKLRYEVSVDVEVPLVTDQRLLKAIIQNLIANSINYADLEKDDPYLVIRVSRKDLKTIITIRDNGCGIPDKHR
ncbi:MAG: histidine kinase N-terminal 7TM domain-containing protein, partial [Flavobacteriales bacterium]